MKKTLLLLLTAGTLTSVLRAEPITVLTSGNRLITVDSANTATATSTITITGLATGETLRGLDYRPATGGLYGVGSTGTIYLINRFTGVATVSSTLSADATDTTSPFTALAGTSFGVDFNPVPDRLRVVSDTDQDLRINVATGATTTDGTLAYAAGDANAAANPNIVGVAYTNNFSGAQATTLYDIDSSLDILAIQNPPNDGALRTVGPLGVDTSDSVGFDISGTTGVAYASLTAAGSSNLYVINLMTGAATIPTGNTGTAGIAPTARGTETVIDIVAGVNTGSRLMNLSARGRVGQGQDVLISGFITQATAGSPAGVSSRVLIRAMGPGLASSGITSPLPDPQVTVYDSNGTALQSNDDWRSTQQAEISATGLAPANDLDSALIATLTPGTYTAVVSGKGTASGAATLEIYQL